MRRSVTDAPPPIWARIRHHGPVPLSETSLLTVAGDLVYARGEDYVRYVRGLRTTDFKADHEWL